MTTGALPLSYVLPLKAQDPDSELAAYLAELCRLVDDVVVVDASPPAVAAEQRRLWPAAVRACGVDADVACANGKAAGVLSGLRRARHEAVVVADDDVRHDAGTLSRLLVLLDDADVVVPANHFSPRPWHARWDTARTLLNRALGHDYPGTLGVRRSALATTGGYDGDVLFENRELIETVRATGGVIRHAPDLHVRRLPPTTRHFLDQRLRQAYDSLAQPGRLAAELALLPVAVATVRRGPRAAAWLVAAAMGLAEVGRRRDDGTAVFPATAALWAPLWLLERAVCSWLAVATRLRGGVRYGGARLARAATPRRELRRRHARARHDASAQQVEAGQHREDQHQLLEA